MRNTMLTYIDRFMHDRHSRRVLGSVLLVLAIVVSLTVYWQLRLHGIAITNETYCGYEEHVHTEECYETTLICGLEETVGLTSDWHVHDESCYDEEGNLVCELEECEPHTHTDECYETTLICEIPEHTHTTDCLVDLEADVEDATVWEATLPELTEDLRTDIVNIAYSQIGYTESTANYTLADDGTTKMGYTRYGAWYGGLYYGSEYSDWDSLFVAFCLDYAGIAEDFTYNSGAYAWSVDLTALGYYQTVDVYSPTVGDVAFIDTDADGRANVTAIVVAVDESAQTITVIQGNYTVTDSEGNSTDTVAVVTYSTATETVTQNEIITLSAGSETEITPVNLGYANVTYVIEAEETEESEDEEEVTLDEEETAELIEEVEEITVEETEIDETETEETEEAEEIEEETVLLTTASAVLTYDEYCSEAYSLYTYAMSVADSTAAASAWDSLMTLWDEIDAAYADGTLTGEEYKSINDIMYAYYYEVYAYYTESVGYDPYGVMTVDEEEGGALTATSTYDFSAYADITWSYDTVTYTDGAFTIDFEINFSGLTKSEIVQAGYTFVLSLSSDIDIPDNILNVTVNGTVSDYTGIPFTYTIKEASDGSYYIEIVFDETYVNALSESTNVSGYIKFEATCDVEDIETDSDGNVVIGTSGETTITIDASEIETSENENWQADVTITKTAANYDATNKSITYTVVIYSKNGTTNEITLSDLLELYGNSGDVDMTVVGVEVDSVTYYSQYYSYSGYGGTSSSLSKDDDYSYTYTISTDGDELNLTITLPKLNGTDSEYSWIIGDCYVIQYTVYIDPDSAEYDSSILNTATASSETDTDTVKHSATASKTATGHSATKSGSYSSTTDEITWTITLNATGEDIAGYTLTDASFAEVLSGLTVTYSNGTTASTDEYTINYVKDINGADTDVIESITFNAITDTNGDDSPDVNTNTYVITYVVSADTSLGTSAYNATNTIEITDDGVDVSEITGQTYVKNNGSMVKEFVSAGSINSDGTTRDISWDTEIYVPVGGISSGTVLYDYVGNWGGDYSSYASTSSTAQWFTYTQIIEGFFAVLVENGIDVGSSNISYYTDGSKTSTNFTLSAYSTTNGWLTYEQLTADSTYEKDVFTAYSITFNYDFDVTGEIKLEYETTVDISTVVNGTATSKTYYNSAKVGSLSSNANYTEYKTVYKTDGNGDEGTTTATISEDGYLTWIVKAYIAPGSTEDYVITDTLPTGLSFVSAYVAISYDYTTLLVSEADTYGNITATLASNTTSDGITATITTVTDSVNGDYEVMAITLDSTDYSWLTSGGGYVTITYTVKIDNFESTSLSGYNSTTDSDGNTTYTIGTYTNSVEVTYDGGDNGDAEQTQTVTYIVEAEGSGGEEEATHDVVIKDGTYTSSTGTITYRVALNIDAEELNGGNDMTFTDTVSTYVGSGYGTYLTLVNGTVKFYELHKLYVEDGTGYYYYLDSDDNKVYLIDSGYVTKINSSDTANYYSVTEDDKSVTYYYKTELSLAWTYSETYSWGTYTHTITSTVIPDSTAILAEYQYSAETASGGTENMNATNTATLTGNSGSEGSDYNENRESWSEPSQSAGLTTDGGITIIKVEDGNYSVTIPNTKFALYYWDSTNNKWVQVTQGDYNYYYPTDSIEKTEITDTNYTNPMDDDNYFTTNASGALTITKNYTDDDNKVLGTYSWYYPWTLYMIVEVEATDGYVISADPIYVYWSEYYDNGNATGSLAYPESLGMYSWNTDVTDLGTTPIQTYITNTPITTFSLTKVSNNDGDTIPNATFALYEYEGLDSSSNEIWKKIGTYKTDANGKITITYDDNTFDLNRAYKLTEVTAADGYNIGWEDITEFYFYWSSDDTTANPEALPTNWGVPGSYATVYDLTAGSVTVEATNTETSTTLEVTKVWVDTEGNVITDLDNYSATVQLYYYLMDDAGNIYTTDGTKVTATSTSTELVTLTTTTGTVANSEVVFVSGTSFESSNTTMSISYDRYKFSATRASVISAIFNDDYSDMYLEINVSNIESVSSLYLFIEGNIDNTSYPILASITGTVIDSDTSSTTISFSISELRKAIENSSYIQDYISANNVTAEVALTALWNSIGLYTTESNPNIKLNSFSIVASAATEASTTLSKTITSSEWVWCAGSGSEIAGAEAEDGAVIAITYTCETSGTMLVGIEIGSIQYYVSVTVSEGSGTIYVPVADLVDSSGNSVYDADWSSYSQTYIFVYDSTFTGTLSTLSVLVPSSSETTEQAYSAVYTADGSEYRQQSGDTGTDTLTSAWTMYLYRTWVDDSELLALVQTEGAVVYIEYDCTEAPTWTNVGVQNTYDWTNEEYSIALSEGTSNYIAIPLSWFSSKSINYWNCLYLNGDGSATIKSVSVLVPYDITENITGVIASDAGYAVTLYHPYLRGILDSNDEYSNNGDGTITISHTDTSSTTWNAISNAESEPTYSYTAVNDTENTTYFTGYAFFDAIYSNLDSEVVITVSGVDSNEVSALSNTYLLIQGDKSFGTDENGYGTMASVGPPTVTYVSDGVYTLTYSSEAIRQALVNNSYTDAASVFADYNALVLAISGSTTIEATVTDLVVQTTEELSASETYVRSSLIGVSSTAGVPYTDENGNTYTYTLDDSNNWTIAVANLPLTMDVTINGETVTLNRYYYFVETGYTGGTTAYTTTYSQTEGENGGGEIVISNIATSYILPSTGFAINIQNLYEFGAMLILLSLVGAGAYRNISRIRKSLVEEPHRDGVDPGGTHERLPNVRNRKFVTHRHPRKGDTRAGPDG